MDGCRTTYIGYITYMADTENTRSKISPEAQARLDEMPEARRELFTRIIEAQGSDPNQD